MGTYNDKTGPQKYETALCDMICSHVENGLNTTGAKAAKKSDDGKSDGTRKKSMSRMVTLAKGHHENVEIKDKTNKTEAFGDNTREEVKS